MSRNTPPAGPVATPLLQPTEGLLLEEEQEGEGEVGTLPQQLPQKLVVLVVVKMLQMTQPLERIVTMTVKHLHKHVPEEEGEEEGEGDVGHSLLQKMNLKLSPSLKRINKKTRVSRWLRAGQLLQEGTPEQEKEDIDASSQGLRH